MFNAKKNSGTKLEEKEHNQSHPQGTATKEMPSTSKNSGTYQSTKTRIVIKYDVGFNNSLYIRGNIGNLNWNKGVQLKNVKADEWVWETDKPFPPGEFKILINDQTFEKGPNHQIQSGNTVQYSPSF